MNKGRMEAFSDGVIAIIITIMVLELKVPHGADWHALSGMLPVFLSYVLSYTFMGIYWNNHHHLLHTCEHVNGGVMWANLHLLFWLSLTPFATAWIGENPHAPLPYAIYGTVLLISAVAYYVLQRAIIAAAGPHSTLKQALGRDWKGRLSPVGYLLAIGFAFVNHWISIALYVGVALVWLIPDRRIARTLSHE